MHASSCEGDSIEKFTSDCPGDIKKILQGDICRQFEHFPDKEIFFKSTTY